MTHSNFVGAVTRYQIDYHYSSLLRVIISLLKPPDRHCKATTTDLQKDGPFRPHTLEPSNSTATAANVPELDEQDPSYVRFFLTPAMGCPSTVSGHGARSSVTTESSDGTLSSPTSSASSSTGESNSDDHSKQGDDPVYDYPNQWLVYLSSGKHIVLNNVLHS